VPTQKLAGGAVSRQQIGVTSIDRSGISLVIFKRGIAAHQVQSNNPSSERMYPAKGHRGTYTTAEGVARLRRNVADVAKQAGAGGCVAACRH
jgi:hypothetical protein